MEICYGICGEGLGHVGRSCRIIDELRNLGHRVNIFTYGEAYNFLSQKHESFLNDINGLYLAHKHSRIDITRTFKNLCNFERDISYNVNRVIENLTIQSWSTGKIPDLFLTDFEPIIPRAAKFFCKPCISIDNQHKLLFTKELPWKLKLYSQLAKVFIRHYIPTNKHIITTFHETDRIPAHIIVRKSLLNVKPYSAGHILVYIKPTYADRILKVLGQIPEEFIVYGPKEQTTARNITIKPVDDDTFVKDLIYCRAIISHAGNQLICEAKYLQKPILVIPIKLQTEQAVNAYYVVKDRLGKQCSINKFSRQIVNNFLDGGYFTYNVKDSTSNIVDMILNLAL